MFRARNLLNASLYFRIHDVSDTKTKPIIGKMLESGGRPLIFSVSFGVIEINKIKYTITIL